MKKATHTQIPFPFTFHNGTFSSIESIGQMQNDGFVEAQNTLLIDQNRMKFLINEWIYDVIFIPYFSPGIK